VSVNPKTVDAVEKVAKGLAEAGVFAAIWKAIKRAIQKRRERRGKR
jgi:flavoprotein